MKNAEDRGLAFLTAEARYTAESMQRQSDAFHALNDIKRFAEVPMINRSTVLDHTARVDLCSTYFWSYLARQRGIELNGRKVSRFALYHDFPEAETGDIPKPVKNSYSEAEAQALKAREREAITQIAEKVAPDFVDLFVADFEEIAEKTSPEAQIVDIADKLDGLCEVITDIRCGNDTPEIGEVYRNYLAIFKDLDRHPMMELLKQSPAFGLDEIPPLEDIQRLSKIDINLLKDGGDAFWERVFDPALPQVYMHWLAFNTNPNSSHLGILPRYRDLLRDYQSSSDARINFYNQRNRKLKQSTGHTDS